MDKMLSLSSFLDDCIAEKYKTSDTSKLQKDMHQDLMPRLIKWMLLKTMTELALLNPQYVDEFRNIVEKKDCPFEAIEEYIVQKIPESTAFLTRVLSEFRNTYLTA